MNEERRLELISAAADGELDPGERAEAERLLSESSAAREFREDLRRLESLLSEVPEPGFPEGLHARIMAGAGRDGHERLARRSFFQLPDFVLRYGLAAAMGALLMVAVHEWRPVDRASYGELVGTMAQGSSRGAARVIDSMATQVDGVSGIVELRQSDGQLLLDIQLDSAEAVELAVDFSTSGLQPVGFTQPRLPFESIEIADQILRARAFGRHRVSVSLRRVDDAVVADQAAIRLEYSSHGRVLKQGSLSPAEE